MGTTHLDGLQVSGVPTMGVNPLPLANNYWFVSSLIGSNGFPGNSYTQPFATLAFAASSTNNPSLAVGDCIVLMEGHAETIAAAGGVTLNTVGLQVVGLGTGNYRPTFTFSTATTATMLFSAASTSISNIIGVTGIDVLATAFDVRAAGCSIGTSGYGYVEWQDPSSSLQAIRQILTTTAANNLIVNLKVIGITSGGTSPVNSVRLVGCDSGLVNIDFYGRASTAVVEFFTGAASTNIEVYGYMYNSGVTNYTKDVVDTVTGSTWFASFYDGAAGYAISGGSGSALGPAQAATVIADLAVPSTDSTANLLVRDVVGSKADTAAPVVAATTSLVALVKGMMNSTQRSIVKADGNVLNGSDPLFTITGGPIQVVSAVGRVTTTIGGVANGTLRATTTVPAGTTAMSTTVAVDSKAAGTVITFVGPTGVLTPTTAGLVLMDYGSTTLTPTQWIVPPGEINFLGSAAQTGVIEWTLNYVPLSPLSVIVTAA